MVTKKQYSITPAAGNFNDFSKNNSDWAKSQDFFIKNLAIKLYLCKLECNPSQLSAATSTNFQLEIFLHYEI